MWRGFRSSANSPPFPSAVGHAPLEFAFVSHVQAPSNLTPPASPLTNSFRFRLVCCSSPQTPPLSPNPNSTPIGPLPLADKENAFKFPSINWLFYILYCCPSLFAVSGCFLRDFAFAADHCLFGAKSFFSAVSLIFMARFPPLF